MTETAEFIASDAPLDGENLSVRTISLTYAFGNFSEEEFFSFLEILRINKFNINDVKNYYYFANKRWDLKLHNDTLIKFPQKNLDNFVLIAKSIIKNKNFNKKKVIDLRIPNQVIISYE